MDNNNPLQYLVQNEEQKRQLAATIKEGTPTAAGVRQLLNNIYRLSRSKDHVEKSKVIPNPEEYQIWQRVNKYDDKSLIDLVSDFLDEVKIKDNDITYVVKGKESDYDNEKKDTDIVEALITERNPKRIKTAIMRRRDLLPIEKANQQVKAVTGEYRRLQDAYSDSMKDNNRLTQQYSELEAELEAERNAHQRSQEEHEAIVYALNNSLQDSEAVLNRATIDYQLQLKDAIDEAKSLIEQALLMEGEELGNNLRNSLEEVRAYKDENKELRQEIEQYGNLFRNEERAHTKTKQKLAKALQKQQPQKSNPTRILHVAKEESLAGGVGTVVGYLNEELNNDNNYSSTILKTISDDNGKFGFEKIEREKGSDFIYSSNFLEQELAQHDIVHIHGLPSFRILEAIDSLKSKGKCPKIVNTCHSNVKKELAVYLHRAKDSDDALCLQDMINKGMFSDPEPFVDTYWGSAIFRQEKVMTLADKVQHMNHSYLKQTIQEYHAEDNAAKHTVIPNGVKIISEKDLTPLPKKKRILFSGRFGVEKGIGEFIEALPFIFKAHPDLEVKLMGGDKEGKTVARYKNKAADLFAQEFGAEAQAYLNAVTFTGWLTDTDKINQNYEWCNFLVAPSNDESFGLAIAEALNHSRIPIATNTESINELFLSKGVGIGIDPDHRNGQGIADAVNNALNAIEEEKMEIMAQKGRELVVENYELEKVIKEQCALYSELFTRS